MRSASAEHDPRAPGFRLARFEVFNWGTFHARVWKIEPSGANALLTGDIGSGKSTLVDALSTLLVPPRKIAYNRAAGADAKERDPHSYVRGEYRSVSNELTGGAQAQSLRGENTYSVLLALFRDESADREVTLAAVFWSKSGERNPARFYVVADQALSISTEFTNFGEDIPALRKHLRARQIPMYESFEEYGTHLRRQLGIPHAQALDLFNQTVSMKSVGNLTEFVRHHMLEADDTQMRVGTLLANFENLNHAHEAVIQARAQIDKLTPLVTDGERLATLESSTEALRVAREALAPWFSGHRVRLLDERIEDLRHEQEKHEQRLAAQTDQCNELGRRRMELETAIERQGGGRIRELERAIESKVADRDRQRKADDDYRKLCAALEIRPGTHLDAFLDSVRSAQVKRGDLNSEKQQLELKSIDEGVEFRNGSEREKGLADEIRSLETRTSNIPLDSIRIRQALAETLEADPEALPFVGELLQVRPEEHAWEGALERLLRGFALSLLVSEELYPHVSHYVDRTHLRGRLVYLRAHSPQTRRHARSASPETAGRKLAAKADSEFYTFLERELVEQFDHVCCEDLAEFRRLPRALTRNGQIKSQERRHDKNDQFPIDQRSRYVLGWDNRAKLKSLREEQTELRNRLVRIGHERARLKARMDLCGQQQISAQLLSDLQDFSTVDWRGTTAVIQKLEDEKQAIENSDDRLKTLREQLAQLNAINLTADKERITTSGLMQSTAEKLEDASTQRDTASTEAATLTEARFAEINPLLEEWRLQALGEDVLQLRTLEPQQQRVRKAMQDRIDANDKAATRLRESIVGQMQQYKAAWPAQTDEMDASTDALPEYRRRLKILVDDDLPRFAAKFKELLNKETINGMANFQAYLQKRRHEIEDRIRLINASLSSIEYDRAQGTFIELVRLDSPDPEVRDFQTELRDCISGAEGAGELYTERKFLEVKTLLERLAGRQGQSDIDGRWSAKVTDVRNWFEFGAKERWRADGNEREFYRDSSGKSGGQKEKLAYTILAAALAYQFGLGETHTRKRHFRFVVIDEAFGRGSDDSTRYGLELFATLDLQLLIVTPLQKIAVIEDYISAVHFVHNDGGSNSMVQNLTIEEYRARKKDFLQASAASEAAAVRE